MIRLYKRGIDTIFIRQQLVYNISMKTLQYMNELEFIKINKNDTNV